MKLKVQKVDSKAKLPAYQSAGAAGFDLHAFLDRPIEIGPNDRITVGTGLSFEIPEGFELQIRPRSGLAFKFGVLTSFGTIDCDYRGEVKINLMNHGRVNITVSPGDRIAQAVLAPVTRAEFELVEELGATKRGKAGFGSTGT